MLPSLAVVCTLGLAWASSALALGPLPDIVGDPQQGRDTFIERGCLACHAVRGVGGKAGPDLGVALVGKGTHAIAAAMLNHFPQMLVAGGNERGKIPELTASGLEAIIAYLFAINFADEPGSPARGSRLFSEAGCIGCHGPGAAERSHARRLGRASIDASALTIAQVMWNHGAEMWRTQRESRVERRRFEPGEFADLLAFLGARVAPLRSGAPALPGDPAAGRAAFEAKGCAACHASGSEGADLAPDFGRESWYRGPSEFAAAMWNHGPNMWARMEKLGIPVPRLIGTDMADVISFLCVLRSAGGPGDSVRGAHVLEEKHCTRCHTDGGSAPALSGRTDLATPIHFAVSMWNHGPRMNELLTKEGLAWPTFSGTDVQDVVAYLRTASDGGSRSP